jgi:hypothetical protein
MPAPTDAYLDQLRDSRQGLERFAESCSDVDWRASVLADGDERPVGVVVDHVAHSYEYLAGWIREIVGGAHPEVNPGIVDALNASHAVAARDVTRDQAAAHLRRSGGDFVELVRPFGPEDLDRDDGRVRRLIEIAILHANDHRSALHAGLHRDTPSSQGSSSPT